MKTSCGAQLQLPGYSQLGGDFFYTNGASLPAHLLLWWDGCGSATSLPGHEDNPVTCGDAHT